MMGGVPPETCRAVFRYNNCVMLHLVGYILEDSTYLILSDTAFQFRTVSMFVTVYFETAFHTRYVAMFVFNLHTKFHFPSSTDSLVISTKPEANEKFSPCLILHYATLLP
jgi:hypothetical protein